MTPPVLDLADVSKDFRGLRPLRIERLEVSPGDCIAIVGMDQPMAEVFVNLVTGAMLPDRGDVRVFGSSTSALVDSAAWLALVDRFGIVSERAVLLEGLSLLQNLAVPLTLDIEPLAEDVRARAITLAREAGLPGSAWDMPVADLDSVTRARVRFGRALALDPAVMILEHPSAAVDREHVASLGAHMQSVVRRRGTALVALTADHAFATAVASRVLALDPASGRLSKARQGWRFGTWLG